MWRTTWDEHRERKDASNSFSLPSNSPMSWKLLSLRFKGLQNWNASTTTSTSEMPNSAWLLVANPRGRSVSTKLFLWNACQCYCPMRLSFHFRMCWTTSTLLRRWWREVERCGVCSRMLLRVKAALP